MREKIMDVKELIAPLSKVGSTFSYVVINFWYEEFLDLG